MITKANLDKLFSIIEEESENRENFLVAIDFLNEIEEPEMAEGLRWFYDKYISVINYTKEGKQIGNALCFHDGNNLRYLPLWFKKYFKKYHYESLDISDINTKKELANSVSSVIFSSRLDATINFLFVWKKNRNKIILDLFINDKSRKT